MEFAVLGKMNLAAREVLSNKDLSQKLDELATQERRDVAELARKNAKLVKELKAAKERIARVEGRCAEKRSG